jgi:hypothetical protein
MPKRACPHCHVASHFSRRWSAHFPSDDDWDGGTVFADQCDNCDLPVCGAYGPDADSEDDVTVWPALVVRPEYPDVPDAIASAAREAHQALAAKAPRASVAMARAVVEATAKDKGITSNGIYSKIEGLAVAGHIGEDTKEAAHEIRYAGNEAAHGDLVADPVGVKEAAEIVELMDVILERVYTAPAKVARIRANREARQSGQAAPAIPHPPIPPTV